MAIDLIIYGFLAAGISGSVFNDPLPFFPGVDLYDNESCPTVWWVGTRKRPLTPMVYAFSVQLIFWIHKNVVWNPEDLDERLAVWSRRYCMSCKEIARFEPHSHLMWLLHLLSLLHMYWVPLDGCFQRSFAGFSLVHGSRKIVETSLLAITYGAISCTIRCEGYKRNFVEHLNKLASNVFLTSKYLDMWLSSVLSSIYGISGLVESAWRGQTRRSWSHGQCLV